MANLTTSEDGVGEFTFTVPEGAAYFVADVVPVEDKVDAKTDLVASGEIDLGDAQTTLTYGSARLEVDDLAPLDTDGVAAFTEAAGDYEIKNYLNISLYNVACKGGDTCEGTEDDSWSEKVETLNQAATISLTLEDGVDGNDIVIVHRKSDGTFEVIPTTYDAATHTLTFQATSFSPYAIASKTTTGGGTGGGTGTGDEPGNEGGDGGSESGEPTGTGDAGTDGESQEPTPVAGGEDSNGSTGDTDTGLKAPNTGYATANGGIVVGFGAAIVVGASVAAVSFVRIRKMMQK